MLALVAVIAFVFALVLKLTGSALGVLDAEAFVIIGLGFVAAHLAHPIVRRR
jgi:hypothetical protein